MSISSFQRTKADLDQQHKGARLDVVPTPHLVVDRPVFIKNCEKMAAAVAHLGWSFRAHIKTHKTPQGARLQCEKTQTGRIIASTLPEIQSVLQAGLVSSGRVKDILLSMPFPIKAFDALARMRDQMQPHGAVLRLLIDNPEQIKALERLCRERQRPNEVWTVYLKLDVGTHRAGLPVESEAMSNLIKAALTSPHLRLFGVYAHAGHSYSARTTGSAAEFLALEVSSTNNSAKVVERIASELHIDRASKMGASPEDNKLVLAVGATPTAHAAQTDAAWPSVRTKHGVTTEQLVGPVELHAGNYCLLDMQQVATGCVGLEDCALKVGASIISTYEDRSEALCDAGAIAMSKDTGPIPGFGPVVFSSSSTTTAQMEKHGWSLGRTSQEHGILTTSSSKEGQVVMPSLGDYIQIVPQHACLTAAQHLYFLVTDDGRTVADIWEPVKGW